MRALNLQQLYYIKTFLGADSGSRVFFSLELRANCTQEADT